jgi:hypothetical protein
MGQQSFETKARASRPPDMLAGRQAEIQAARDRKLEEARQQRQKTPAADGVSPMTLSG